MALSVIHLVWFRDFSLINWMELGIVYAVLLTGTVIKEVNKKYPYYQQQLLYAYLVFCILAVMAFLLIVPKQFLFLPVLVHYFLFIMAALFLAPKSFAIFGYGSGLLYAVIASFKILFIESQFFTQRESLIYISVPFILICIISFLTTEVVNKIITNIDKLHAENSKLKSNTKDTRKLKKEIGKLHSIDSLTNTLNRESSLNILEKFIELSLKYRFGLTIAIVDISNLKEVNRTHGVEVGDLLLKEFADLFKQRKKDSDIISRYSGDSFLLIFPKRTPADCENLLRSISTLERVKFTFAITELSEINVTDDFGKVYEELIDETLQRLINDKLKKRLISN